MQDPVDGLYLAGHAAPAGYYRRLGDEQIVILEEPGYLPASLDGHVACYVREEPRHTRSSALAQSQASEKAEKAEKAEPDPCGKSGRHQDTHATSQPASARTVGGPEEPVQPVRVVLVDDYDICRNGVRSLLEGSEFEVVGEASSAVAALEVVEATRPRMVLMDVRMPGGDGLTALATLKTRFPDLAVVMVTTFGSPTYRARALAGHAAAYVLKAITRDELLTTLRRVLQGERLLTRQGLALSLRGISREGPEGDLIEPLTNRQREVLQLLATGITNREMAAILSISESTVRTHVEHIIAKLGVTNRVQAAVWAALHGLAAAPGADHAPAL